MCLLISARGRYICSDKVVDRTTTTLQPEYAGMSQKQLSDFSCACALALARPSYVSVCVSQLSQPLEAGIGSGAVYTFFKYNV